ncbi:MAG: GTP-binding protein, partial [Actinomycetes bacterium]
NLRKLAMGVVPVAGLLAQSARTLRLADFEALRLLATLDRVQRERMMLSADRFRRSTEPAGVTAEARESLLGRYGLFGIRLAMVLIRNGFADPTPLAHELARRSGLDPLLDVLARQFQSRAEELKARTALAAVGNLLATRPRQGTEQVAASLERLQANAHEFRELRLLAVLRTAGLELPANLVAEAERLIGGRGAEPGPRLDLAPDAAPDVVAAEARRCLARWRAVAESPLTPRSAVEACRVVIRSCEGVLADCAGGDRQPQPA